MIEVEYPVAVSILVSYFVFIFVLLHRIKGQVLSKARSVSLSHVVFILLMLLSFITTWTYMFKFFQHSYQQWHKAYTAEHGHSMELSVNSISHWLHEVSLFDSAWRQVSVGHWQWLWSHQLCSLTVSVWTPLLAIEGTRRNIPFVWAYMLLGQVVAISVASSLFFYVMLFYPIVAHRQPSVTLLKILQLTTLGGIITVIISPFVASTDGFLPNLLVMHALLVIPLIYTSTSKSWTISNDPVDRENSIITKVSVMITSLYVMAAAANISIYINQWMECLSTVDLGGQSLTSIALIIVNTLISTFFGHPAQSSISYDIVCMQLISIAWMIVYNIDSVGKMFTIPTMALIILTPLFSASVTLPLFMAYIEAQKLIGSRDKTVIDSVKKEL